VKKSLLFLAYTLFLVSFSSSSQTTTYSWRRNKR